MTIAQFLPSLSRGDAIGEHVLRLDRVLHGSRRRAIYYEHAAPEAAHLGRPVSSFRRGARETLLYHFSTGAGMVDMLRDRDEDLLLYYHNVTPASFFAPFDPEHARLLEQARAQLPALADRTDLAIAASEYSATELRAAGYQRTAVLPLLVDFNDYDDQVDRELIDAIEESSLGGPDILFVGRIAPNKCQHDLVKLLRVHTDLYGPNARLFLVGPHHPHTDAYSRTVENFADDLGVAERVRLVGRVGFDELLAFYRAADVFVCVSEHEGFGLPLLEAMHLDVPVVATESSAVTETVGDAGLLLPNKDDLAHLAAAVQGIHEDRQKADALRVRGHRRVDRFRPQVVAPRYLEILEPWL